MENFLELLKIRRSSRLFTGEPVDKDMVCDLMRAALMSPSGHRINPWEFILVEDKEMLKALSVSKEHGSGLLEGAAMAVAVVVILVYIAIRFNLLAGVSAVIALLHDVLIMVAFTTIFQLPVNMTFIAAIITIVGYSINATIVVFDRIRELHALPSNLEKTDAEIANEAIAGTLSRSILTSITTLVMITILAIFGSSAIRDFAFPIIFGLLAGLYSSVLLSAPLWVKLRKLFKQENKKPVKKIKKIKEEAKA